MASADGSSASSSATSESATTDPIKDDAFDEFYTEVNIFFLGNLIHI